VSLTVASHYWPLMAEALAVISVVANIIQLVDFSSKVLHRLHEFRSGLGEVPKSFQHFSAELPVLKATLLKVREAIEAGSLSDETEKALIPAIEGCKEQIQLLDSLLAKILPNTTDSRLRRSTKAILSLNQEAKVQSITKILHSYIRTLTFYYTVESSTLQPLTGDTLLRYYRISLLNPSHRCKAHQNPPVVVATRSIPELRESSETTTTRHWPVVS
jgi:hypothetical protein